MKGALPALPDRAGGLRPESLSAQGLSLPALIASAWPADCHSDLELAIAEFKTMLPGWWYSVGECQVSCDASCGPTRESRHLGLIALDRRFDDGFHADLAQPSTLSEALRAVMTDALEAVEAANG